MLVVMVRMSLSSSEQGEQMINRFKNRAGLVDNLPGFLGFELLRAEGELVSMTRWASREDLDRWMNSQAHAQSHGGSGGPMQGQGSGPQAGSGGLASSQPPGAPAGAVTVYEVVIPRGEQA